MKKITTILFSFMLLVIFNQSVKAQFTLSGEVRPRAEYSHGYQTLAVQDQDPSFFISQRTRLNAFYKGDRIVTKLVIQDVRTWGAQKQLVDNSFNSFANANELNTTVIHEGWAEAFFTDAFSVKAGRMQLVYDDHRIFGSVGWAQQARVHDLAMFKYEGDFKLHVGLAYNQNTNRTNNFYLGPDAYKAMQYAWFNKKWDALNLSVLFLNKGDAFVETDPNTGVIVKESIKYNQTFGSRAEYKTGDLKLAGNFYLQSGKNGADKSVSAYEVALDANYEVTDEIGVFGGYEILSGSKYDIAADKTNSFNPFFGTNHKFNGFMDYFYTGNHANNVGLQDIHFGGKYTHGKWFGQLKALIFLTAAELYADANPYLGTEVDLWGGYKVTDEVSIGVGYSHLFATETMESLKGSGVGSKDETQNWGYVMLTFKPKFFTYNKPENEIPSN